MYGSGREWTGVGVAGGGRSITLQGLLAASCRDAGEEAFPPCVIFYYFGDFLTLEPFCPGRGLSWAPPLARRGHAPSAQATPLPAQGGVAPFPACALREGRAPRSHPMGAPDRGGGSQ